MFHLLRRLNQWQFLRVKNAWFKRQKQGILTA